MATTDTIVHGNVNTIVKNDTHTFVAMSTFGDRVREERVARGWSRHDLAVRVSKAAGVTCPDITIAKIEDRASKISQWSLSIAAALNVEHDWLLTGKGVKLPLASIDKRLKRLKPDAVERLFRQINVLIDDEENQATRPH